MPTNETFKVSLTDDVAGADWEALLAVAPEATVFHTQEWLEVVRRTYKDRRAAYILAHGEGGRLIAGMPVIKYRRFGFTAWTSTIWGTPLAVPGNQDALAAILDFFAARYDNPTTLYLSVSDHFGKCAYLKTKGFLAKPDFFHRLDLAPGYGQLREKKFNRSIRKNINTALRAGLSLENVENSDQVRQYYKIAAHTYVRRSGRMIYPPEFYDKIFEIMQPKGLVKWHLVKKAEQPIAGAIHLIYKETVFNLLEASYRDCQGFRPNDLLISEMIKWGVRNGYRYYNFGSSPVKAEGLIRFKENWGAQKIEYQVHEKVKPIYAFLRSLKAG